MKSRNFATTLSTSRRERRKTETLNRILSSAIRLFGERGYAETTVEDITEAADIGKGTFFNYFPTKDAVLVAIFDALRQEFAALEARASQVGDARQALHDFIHENLSSTVRTPRLIRGIFGHALNDPEMGRRVESVMLQARQAITILFESGQKLGQIRRDIPAPVLARTFQQFIFGTQIVWALTTEEDLHCWVDVMLDVFWNGASPGARESLQ
jgi:AcrR family transcriptional regulator